MKKIFRLSPTIEVAEDDIESVQQYQRAEEQLLTIMKADGTVAKRMDSPLRQLAIRLKDGRTISFTRSYAEERQEFIGSARYINDLPQIEEQLHSVKYGVSDPSEDELIEELRRFLAGE
jgi:ferritin